MSYFAPLPAIYWTGFESVPVAVVDVLDTTTYPGRVTIVDEHGRAWVVSSADVRVLLTQTNDGIGTANAIAGARHECLINARGAA